MTAGKQEIEIAALIAAFNTHLSPTWGTLIFNDGFDVGDQIVPNTLALQYLPNGPEPFQLGDTTQKYYQRVLQIDMYMSTKGRASGLIDELMDYIDLMAIIILDPLNSNVAVGSITCQNTDSIYGEIAPPNLLNPKVIRWRGIVRATVESHYPNG